MDNSGPEIPSRISQNESDDAGKSHWGIPVQSCLFLSTTNAVESSVQAFVDCSLLQRRTASIWSLLPSSPRDVSRADKTVL